MDINLKVIAKDAVGICLVNSAIFFSVGLTLSRMDWDLVGVLFAGLAVLFALLWYFKED